MNLTPELKKEIDSRTYKELLAKWRFASIGDPMFQDESGEYYSQKMAGLRVVDPARAVQSSREIGWF